MPPNIQLNELIFRLDQCYHQLIEFLCIILNVKGESLLAELSKLLLSERKHEKERFAHGQEIVGKCTL